MTMKNKIFTYLILILLLGGLLMAACGPATPGPGGPQSWIDAPLYGSSIPLAPYEIIAHAAFPSGISEFELSITGQGPQTIPAPADQSGQTLVYINHMWTPPAPGTYLIQVRASGPDGAYGPAAEAQVHVGDAAVTDTPAAEPCIWTAAVNVFVRTGPGSSIYPEITAVEAGTMLPVVGQSEDQQFWAVQLGNGQVGYVPKAERFGLVSGECNPPVLPDPATPVPTEPPPPDAPQCSDGLDNDGDGRIDFIAAGIARLGVRECLSPDDKDEANR
jgi:hypothetical protein